MMTLFQKMRASIGLTLALAGATLVLLAGVAWRFSVLSPRSQVSVEARPFQAQRIGVGDRGTGKSARSGGGQSESEVSRANKNQTENQKAQKPNQNGASNETNHYSKRSTWTDSDSDGIPDVAELRSFRDRESFRRWFTAIAEVQFYELSDEWNKDQRDCAGLIRFAWREALRRHDRLWFQKMGKLYEPVASDVDEFNLENGPLGERLFRTRFGSFKTDDLTNGGFSEFADARTLESFNSSFISRDRGRAQPGDLLLFYQPTNRKFPFHVMLFVGSARIDSEGGSDWVVYHTGSTATDEGVVKKVRLAVLDQHPDKRW
jgi:hypothetical protein